MQWAHAITVESGRLAVDMVNSEGVQERAPLSKLASVGVPAIGRKWRSFENVRLAEFERVSEEKYLEQFGLADMVEPGNHAVFLLTRPRTKWVIPALVLMRALFKPNNLLLAEAFRHRAVERLTMPSPEDETQHLYVARGKKMGAFVEPNCSLHWLLRDLGAKTMMESVHRHALDGRIDIDLANIEVTLKLSGVANGRTVYVTRVNIPQAHGSDDNTLTFQLGAKDGPSVAGISESLKTSLRSDGQVAVTDEEWERVCHYLSPYKRGRPPNMDKRELLDSILHRLTGHTSSWTELEKTGSSVGRLLGNCTHWMTDGRLKKVVDELNAMRGQGCAVTSS